MRRQQRRRAGTVSFERTRGAAAGRPLVAEQLERRLALAIVTPFAVRYTANDTGDITFAANTLMTAPASDPAAVNAQNGVGSKLNNNDFVMTYVDIDSDSTTWNSSSADLVMPAGSQVLFAGLYWGGRTNSTSPTALTSQRDNVLFKASGAVAYTPLVGTTIGETSSSYQSFRDVTSLVQESGAGAYTVANVRSVSEQTDRYAGWALVVAYRAPGEPARNLTVFDGYGTVNSGDPAATITISGFKAPTSGPVNATLGFVTYEGDLGLTGDKVLFNGGKGAVQLQNAANPANNFFNSTISNRGSTVATRSPNYVNQLGFDADLVAANGVIANGATTAQINLTTGGETYYPGVVTSAIELFAPDVTIVKTVEDLDGDNLEAGDELLYTMVVANAPSALDAAVNVRLTDVVPEGTTFVPGSLSIDGVPKTDAADLDQAQYVVAGNEVQYQLGAGAGGAGTSGGRLASGASTTVTFRVTVNPPLAPFATIRNVANVTYTGETSGFNLESTDFAEIVSSGADLAVVKTDDNRSEYVAGQTFDYTIVVTNNGPANVVGARLVDTLPPEIASATWSAVYSAGSSGPPTGSGDIDVLLDLLAGGTATFTVTVTVRQGAFGNLSNTATIVNPADAPDPNPDNNSSSDTNVAVLPANLTLKKSVADLNGGFLVAGDRLRYTIVVANPSTSTAVGNEAATNLLLQDAIPVGTTYAGNLTFTQGSLTGGSGGVNGSLGALAMGQTATITFDVTVNSGIAPATVITNTARVDGTGSVSGDPLVGQDSAGIAAPPAADLTVRKTGSPTFVPGQTDGVVFTIVVTNTGPTAVTGAQIVDALPAGLTGINWTATYAGASSSGPASGTGDINTVVNLGVDGTATFTVRATAPAATITGAVLSNTATATTPGGVPDPNPDDNTSTTTTTATPITDLAIVKTDGRPTYVPGTAVTYTITVTNNGPSFASQASVIDTLDPEVIASATWTAVFTGTGSGPADPSGTAGTGSIDQLVNLAPGGTAVYTVVAQTLAAARKNLVNTATVAPSNLSNDPDPGNNSSTDTNTLVLPAELDLTKQVRDLNGGFVQDGDILQYTITVSNPAGDPVRETAINVGLTDLIPANTTYVAGSATTSQGSVIGSGAGVTATIGTLAAGSSATIVFRVTVNAGTPASTTIANTATATGTGQQSNQPLADSAAANVVTPPGADIAIVKSGPARYVPGRALTYTLVVTNSGPSTSSNTTVVDTLPAGLSNVSWTANYRNGAAGPASGSGNLNVPVTTLPQGGVATFTITATPAATLVAPLVNTATANDPSLPDPTPSNNTSTLTSTANPTADLAIVKTDGQSTYSPGRSVTYTITVTNAGPSHVTGARVQDTFSSIVTNATWTATITTGSGSVANASGSGTIDEVVTLGPGAVAVYTVTVITSSIATTNLVNTATVTVPAGVTDPDPSNNTSTDTNTPNFSPAVILGNEGGCDASPLVRVIDPATGAVKAEFLAYEASFRGGVRVYGADVTGDGIEEIITGPGPGRAGEVRVFTQNGVELPAYRTFPFGRAFTGGVEVAAGPVTAVGAIDLVAAQGSGGNLVRVFTVTPGAADPVPNIASRQFRPFGPTYTGGARIATADIGSFSGSTPASTSPDGIFEIIAGSGAGGRATVVAQNAVPAATARIGAFNPIAPNYTRGVTVARMPGSGGAADRVLASGGLASGTRVETWSYSIAPTRRFVRDAAFAAYPGTVAAVGAAALDAANIYAVQGTAGKTNGVKRFTSPAGSASATLPSSTTIAPPQRISVLRR